MEASRNQVKTGSGIHDEQSPDTYVPPVRQHRGRGRRHKEGRGQRREAAYPEQQAS